MRLHCRRCGCLGPGCVLNGGESVQSGGGSCVHMGYLCSRAVQKRFTGGFTRTTQFSDDPRLMI